LNHLRCLANLQYASLERTTGIGVDPKDSRLTDTHCSNIGFANRRVYAHVRKISGDSKERRCLQARGHRLTALKAASDDPAIHRGSDYGSLQVDFGTD